MTVRRAKVVRQAPSKGEAKAWTAREVLAALRAEADPRVREGMTRVGIGGASGRDALGVRMPRVWAIASRAAKGRGVADRHELAAALWETGVYEARMAATRVDHPSCVTEDQMDAWCRDVDNWALCDTACIKLFARVQHAVGLCAAKRWARGARAVGGGEDEFVVRAAPVLLAALATHNPACTDKELRACLALLERLAGDDRNFVKKAVGWALREIGGRRPLLRAEVVELARRLSSHKEASARWIGKDVLRELCRKIATT